MVGRDLADFYPPRASSRPGAPALTIRGGANRRLNSIDLDVRAGEIVGVAGLEGSGKDRARPRRRRRRAVRAGSDGDRRPAGEAAKPAGGDRGGLGRLSDDRKREGLLMQQSLRDNAMLIQRAFASPFRSPTAEPMSTAQPTSG